MELRPERRGGGFTLPKEQIIPVGEEVMAFHISIAKQIIHEFV